MSLQAARASTSPALGATSYGQVIEYIQSRQLHGDKLPAGADQRVPYVQADKYPQIEFT